MSARPYSNVHAVVKADAELKFAAALVAAAIEATHEGDSEAYEWIEWCSPRWINLFTPEGDDPGRIHAQLLDTLTRPDRQRGATA